MRRIAPLSMGLAAVLALAACGGSGGDGGSSEAGASGKTIKVGYAAPVLAQPGQQAFGQGAGEAAKVIGAKLTQYDSNVQSARQITNLQTMLQQKMDVIGTWTLDPGATAAIYGQIRSAGIPLIGTNSDDNGIQYSVWTENTTCEKGGPWEQTADLIARKAPGGKVITIGLDGVPSIDANVKCFTDAAKAKGLQIVAHVSNTSDDSAGGQRLIADMLTRHPDVDAIWGYNDASALGASAALGAAGKKISDGTSDGVVVTGSNGDTAAIDAVREGRLTATWDPNNREYGWLFMKIVKDVEDGKAAARTVLKSTLITKDTVGSWVDPSKRTISFDTLQFTTAS
ncbi:sugar ABC transporter substrate-binding protein [Frankia canadensis]|nr:sugar ABC transporter substrate-binding protein [Frankia canadensis]